MTSFDLSFGCLGQRLGVRVHVGLNLEIAGKATLSFRPLIVAIAVPKEPHVLSGRSLQCLARHISGSGIKLAVELDVSDSTISGMTFDTLANGHTASDITYRMLLMWKRRITYCYQRSVLGMHGRYDSTAAGNAQVDMLVQAVAAATGSTQVADVITECHRTNRELTPDGFLAAPRN